MASIARYDPSFEGVGEMLRSGGIRREMRSRALRVKAAFEATASVDTGEWKASATVDTYIRPDRRGGGSRVVAAVTSNDPDALSKEFGHIAHRTGIGPPRFVPGDHAMTRALGAATGI